jgi:hypothetical protein
MLQMKKEPPKQADTLKSISRGPQPAYEALSKIRAAMRSCTAVDGGYQL